MSRPEAGLAAQRTRLAWRRTVLASGVVALLAARFAITAWTGPAEVLAVAAAMAAWAAFAAIAYRRSRGLARTPHRPVNRALRAAALAVAAYALIGTALILR